MKKHSLKLISLLLSVLLWAYILSSEKVRIEKIVTLEYILPENMMFAVKPIGEAVFIIHGSRAFARSLTEKEERIVIDLNRLNTHQYLNFNIDLTPSQLKLPRGMVTEKIIPKKLNLRLEKREKK